MNTTRTRVLGAALAAVAALGVTFAGTASATAASAKPRLGNLYYVDRLDGGVLRWTGSGGPQGVAGDGSGANAIINANVSPDGRYLSWVDLDDSTLHVVDATTGTTRVVRGGIDGLCREPAWNPDSKRLVVSETPGGGLAIVDLATGGYTRLPSTSTGCHPTWAADGKALAYPDAGSIVVVNPDGTGRRTMPGHGWDEGLPRVADIESVSAGGKRVAASVVAPGDPVGDVVRSLFSSQVLDIATGKPVRLPAKAVQTLLRADGSMVLRVERADHYQIVLVAANGSIVNRYEEPTALKNATLLTT